MAQLSDDCFAFGGPLLTILEAERLIHERLSPVPETETIAIAEARGRVLAEDVIALINLPPFDNSAVDGYAIRHADLSSRDVTRYPVAERIMAGDAGAAGHRSGTAARIFTGAPMPPGTDTVYMQEDCRTEGADVILPAGLKLGANRRLKGEDVREGQTVIGLGTRLGVQHIAMASAVGVTRLRVRRRLRVALFSTGNEVAEPGAPLRPGQIYDANRPLLAGMAGALGAEVTDLGILKDDLASLGAALANAARDHDLVLTSGGVSTGEGDLVRTAVEDLGSLVFWRIAIKPGRPVALGVLHSRSPDRKAAFAGLPGNPVAAFVTFARIVRPMLLRMSGARSEPLIGLPVRLSFSYRKKENRREYVRVSLRVAADGITEAVKHPQDGAGVLSSLTATDGLIELEEKRTSIAPGEMANFLPYSAIIGSV